MTNFLELFLSILDVGVIKLLISVLLMISLYWYLTTPKGLPPGPNGIPVFGYMPFIRAADLLNEFNKLGKRYGNLFSFYFGKELVVVLNDWESIKAAFIQQADNFTARPLQHPFITTERAKFNLEVSEGEHWKEHKRFALQTLRDFGFGKSSLEPSISAEVQQFIAEVEKRAQTGKVTNLTDVMTPSVLNVLGILASGTRYDYDDPELHEFMTLFFSAFNDISLIPRAAAFPWVKRLPGYGKLSGVDSLRKAHETLLDFIEVKVREHEENHQEGQADDYMHAFLTHKAIRATKISNDKFYTREILTDIAGSNFFGGGFGVVMLLQWGVLFLTLHQDIQKRIQAELDEVVGKDRLATFEDRHRTPYTDAFVLEVIRYPKAFPINSPHSNYSECTILGHRIPKRSFVLSNIWNVNHDPKLWDEPEKFKPERFISTDGKVTRPEYLMTFSCGKRACPAELLTRMQVYLYIVGIAQRFNLLPPPGEKITNEATGLLLGFPKHQDFIVQPRQ